MTIAEKGEQTLTNRPSSYVPGHTLERLLGLAPRPDSEIFHLNMAMHYGQGAAAACIRGLMSFYGVRGPFADFMFTGIRLLIDQTLENWTGVGAPPWYDLSISIHSICHQEPFFIFSSMDSFYGYVQSGETIPSNTCEAAITDL